MALALLTLSCAAQTNPVSGVGDTYWQRGPGIGYVTRYPVTITRRTPGGVAVDDPGGELDDSAIDRAFDVVAACLAQGPRRLTDAQTAAWGGMSCHHDDVPATVDRSALVIKVAPGWITGPNSHEQLFTCSIDNRGCAAKGLPPATPTTPCMCRHAVQWRDVLVVTPNLKLLPAAIVEAVTTCENPWVGVLAKCAAPI